MAAPYVKRYPGGFVDKPSLTTAVDSAFLNAVESALLQLLGEVPAADEVGVWVGGAGGGLVYQKITNSQIAAAAGIDKSKLAALNIVDADISGGAAIAKSKLAALNIANADVVAGAAIDNSKLALPDGWYPISETLTFGAADAPSYTATTPSDVTAKYPVGAKIKLTHAAATKYFIVTASAFAAGSTTLTLYGGTDYALAAGAITAPFFSIHRAPFGFPLNPTKWTVEVSLTVSNSQAAAVAGTWYNIGALSIFIPIGVWHVHYSAGWIMDSDDQINNDIYVTLSTSATAGSDADFTYYAGASGLDASSINQTFGTATREKVLGLAAKTQYFLNFMTQNAGSTLYHRANESKTIIRAVCAYL